MLLFMPKKAIKDALFNVAKIETVFTEFGKPPDLILPISFFLN